MGVQLPAHSPTREFTQETAFSGATGAGVRVAVIDSGIDHDHPMLGDCVDTEGSILFSVDEDGDVVSTTGIHSDAYGHGTAVAGIIHALAPQASITSVRVLGENLSGKAAAFHAGLAWAVDEGFDIVNLSLGTTRSEWALAFHETCDRAYFGNTFVVTAANNVQRASYPSLFASVASVACNTTTDPLRFHANPHPPTEFLARGIDIEVPWIDGKTTTITGNSFAAPHIAGLATLIKSKHPDLRPFQIKAALWATSANVVESTPPEPAGRRTTAFVLASQTPAASFQGEEIPAGYDLEGNGTATRWGILWDAKSHGSDRKVSIHQFAPSDRDPASTATQLRLVVAKLEALSLDNLADETSVIDRPWLGLVGKRRDGMLGGGVSGGGVLAESSKLSLPDAMSLASALCNVLDAVHGVGIVHGALAMSAITNADDRWLVHDTSLTTALEKPSPAAATALDPNHLGHLAPEQLNGSQADPLCDLYSVGFILFYVITGRPPYPADVPVGKYLRDRLTIAAPTVRSLEPKVAEHLASAIDRCLQLDPQDRPGSIKELRNILTPPVPDRSAQDSPLQSGISVDAEFVPPDLGTHTEVTSDQAQAVPQRGRRWRRK